MFLVTVRVTRLINPSVWTAGTPQSTGPMLSVSKEVAVDGPIGDAPGVDCVDQAYEADEVVASEQGGFERGQQNIVQLANETVATEAKFLGDLGLAQTRVTTQNSAGDYFAIDPPQEIGPLQFIVGVVPVGGKDDLRRTTVLKFAIVGEE